jgi:uncharacterized membrane protein SpoIIM required for sporulation/ABC-type transport system involved in multi-copper enzyme maturation permease subunit
LPRKHGFRATLSNALIITRREVRDSFRDWRILVPIVVLTFLFPALAQFIAGRFTTFVTGYGAEIVGERTIPFLLMVVGFFPISISLVIALETFVGEKERKSLEPLFSTPLTNTELYIGKTLAAMIPPLISSYGGMLVYLGGLLLSELAWRPQAALIVQIFLLTTVQALLMVTGAVVVSSQTTSTRAANLLASFIIIPMTLIIQGESVIMFLAPDADSPNGIGALWAIIVGMFVAVLLLLRLGNSVFNREEVLGRSIDQINLRSSLRKIGRHIHAVDDAGTPARNLIDWYRRSIPLSMGRLRKSLILTAVVFVAAFIGGIVLGQQPGWRLPALADAASLADREAILGGLDLFTARGILTIALHNGQILAGVLLLSIFTFGIAALVIPPATYLILGFAASQLIAVGFGLPLLLAAVLTHGVIEIPVIAIATATALNLGAIITRPPNGWTVGHAWSLALADAVKLWLGVILPGLLVAAVVEAFITPVVVRLLLGG